MKKYKILVDYHSDGYQFNDKEFESLEEAVKYAVSTILYNPFLIVQVIDWKAVEV